MLVLVRNAVAHDLVVYGMHSLECQGHCCRIPQLAGGWPFAMHGVCSLAAAHGLLCRTMHLGPPGLRARPAGKLKLLADWGADARRCGLQLMWRDTSPQHFNTSGGEWPGGEPPYKCVAHRAARLPNQAPGFTL